MPTAFSARRWSRRRKAAQHGEQEPADRRLQDAYSRCRPRRRRHDRYFRLAARAKPGTGAGTDRRDAQQLCRVRPLHADVNLARPGGCFIAEQTALTLVLTWNELSDDERPRVTGHACSMGRRPWSSPAGRNERGVELRDESDAREYRQGRHDARAPGQGCSDRARDDPTATRPTQPMRRGEGNAMPAEVGRWPPNKAAIDSAERSRP